MSKSTTQDNAEEDTFKFSKDEKVLILPAVHGENIYEAKVLDRKRDANSVQYNVHYHGWNKRWDEWLDQRRVLKINASTLTVMNEKNGGHTHHRSTEAGTKRKLRSSNGSSPPNNNKRRRLKKPKHAAADDDGHYEEEEEEEDSDADEDEDDQKKKRKERRKQSSTVPAASLSSEQAAVLEINLPKSMKKFLINDWEKITKKAMLMELPRTCPHRIVDILQDFECAAMDNGHDHNVVLEISRGIRDYFNQALHVTLLYKSERQQYQAISAQHAHLEASSIYGAEHLCRLFVKLPQLLSPVDLDVDTRRILQQQIQCIIEFIMKHQTKYFNTNYIALS
mmetsp:Transcript_18778/g.29882  ORF Transcript_18778/g.29882 Transcript_18778/m.29882 type:complete len:337 (+) Transcript_18778:84-1094(+)